MPKSPILAAALFAAAAIIPAGAQELTPGRLLERVPCRTSGHSYALYLPAAYTAQKRWPAIYCFDPGGNGAVPARLLLESAERLGWIVIGSNNSRNGPAQAAVEAARILWNETAFLAIDRRRVYAAGFSGGAHVALAAAVMFEPPLAGVLACSNGLPAGLSAAEFPAGTVFFTSAGLSDFNYRPVMRLTEQLQEHGLTVECELFPSFHTWPPMAVLYHALEWFEVQAMRAKTRPRDEDLAARVLERLRAGILEAERRGRPAEALEGWTRLIRAWEGLDDLPEARARAQALRNSPRLPIDQKRRGDEQRREQEQWDQLSRSWTRLWAPAAEPAAHSRRIAALGVRELRRTAEKRAGTPEGDAAQRLLGLLSAEAQARGQETLAAGRFDDAILCFEIVEAVRPGRPAPLYNLACAHCRAGDRKKGLEYLQRAVEAGFRNFELLAADEDLKPLRGDPAFARLIERLRGLPVSSSGPGP
ncbi:MAG: hypothetical protein ABFD80_07790 [Acidobacteriota bacterium]